MAAAVAQEVKWDIHWLEVQWFNTRIHPVALGNILRQDTELSVCEHLE